MKITIQAKIDKPPALEELPVCVPVLMRDRDGKTVVVIRGIKEALSFNPSDGSICYSDHTYYTDHWTFIREFGPSDSFTVKGAIDV